MRRKIRLYLENIKDAIKKIEKYTQKTSFKKFANDQKTKPCTKTNGSLLAYNSHRVGGNFPPTRWESVNGITYVALYMRLLQAERDI